MALVRVVLVPATPLEGDECGMAWYQASLWLVKSRGYLAYRCRTLPPGPMYWRELTCTCSSFCKRLYKFSTDVPHSSHLPDPSHASLGAGNSRDTANGSLKQSSFPRWRRLSVSQSRQSTTPPPSPAPRHLLPSMRTLRYSSRCGVPTQRATNQASGRF